MKKVHVRVIQEKLGVGQFPHIDTAVVYITTDNGIWIERVSKKDLAECLRFLAAGVNMAGGSYEEVGAENIG